MIVLLLFTSCKEDDTQPSDPDLFVPPTVSRTITQIALVDQMTVEDVNLKYLVTFDSHKALDVSKEKK